MAPTSVRTAGAGAGLAYAVQAVALSVVLLATGAIAPLAVVATFSPGAASTRLDIASLDLGWAVVTVLAGGAIMHAVAAAIDPSTRQVPQRWRLLHLAGWSQGSSVLVFLIAVLNGIQEVTALVPLYAITAVAVILHGVDRNPDASTWQRPGAWGAVVGIVPWGVIAFAQIGATLAFGGPDPGVRIVTVLGLAVAALGWVIAWRRPASARSSHLVVMTVGVSVVAWSLVASVVLVS